MKRTLITIPMALALLGCDAISDGFDDGFAEEFAATCEAESNKLGVPADVSTAMCACAAERTKDELSMSEKLGSDTSKVDAIMDACLDEIVGDGEIAIEPNEAS